jgi:hypothetical protein
VQKPWLDTVVWLALASMVLLGITPLPQKRVVRDIDVTTFMFGMLGSFPIPTLRERTPQSCRSSLRTTWTSRTL